MYKVYFGTLQLPITPSKITTTIKGNNKTLTLANDSDINFLRLPGLTEISFTATLPMLGKYSFSSAYQRPDYYLNEFEKMMVSRTPFQLIISRISPSGKRLYSTNIKVSLEDYKILEDATKGPDVEVEFSLKQYVEYATKIVKVIQPATEETPATIEQTTARDASSAPSVQTYTVKPGDTLWLLAKRFYGDGAQYMKIYNANTDKLSSPNTLTVGQVLTIPDANAVINDAPASTPKKKAERKTRTVTIKFDGNSKAYGWCSLRYKYNGKDDSKTIEKTTSVEVDAGSNAMLTIFAQGNICGPMHDEQWLNSEPYKIANDRYKAAALKYDSEFTLRWVLYNP